MPCGSQAHHSIRRLAPLHHKSKHGLTVSVPVHSSLGCPCRDVGEAIPVGSLRPIRTARKTLGGHTLERPSCGGFMPTAETTLIPAYMTDECTYQPKSLTRSARLDNEPNVLDVQKPRSIGRDLQGKASRSWRSALGFEPVGDRGAVNRRLLRWFEPVSASAAISSATSGVAGWLRW